MMRTIEIDRLYDYNYSIEVINALKQQWHTKPLFSCMGTPKEINMFLYISGCSAEYTLKDKSKVYAKSGSIIYTPISCEYSVRFFDFQNKDNYTIGVNFFLFDKTNEPFILNNNIVVFDSYHQNCTTLFKKVDTYSEANVQSPSRMKAAMYDILSILSEAKRKHILHKEKFGIIEKGINYLENDNLQALSIKEIADMCNVSEVYFRRLFKEYAGVSPIKYRISNKIEKAKIYIEYENMTLQEISDRLGFISPAYFTSQFKSIVGITPSEFKNSVITSSNT